jgi:hypothetical protein
MISELIVSGQLFLDKFKTQLKQMFVQMLVNDLCNLE